MVVHLFTTEAESYSHASEGLAMLSIQNGQCGLCTHYGEGHAPTPVLISILSTRQAPESLIDSCGLPKNAALHLKVTPVSGCDGFQEAKAA
jgi:hypothetical protein